MSGTGPSARDGFAHGEGVRLHYQEVGLGDGDPVVLLPGWPQTGYAWRHVVPLLADAGYRAIVFDLPGQAHSGFMPEGVGYSAAAVAAVVHSAAASLGIQRFHLVSHDVGAWVAFSLASLYPDSVRRLAMLDTQLLGISPPPQVANAPRAFQYFLNFVPGLGEMLTRNRERELLAFLFERKSLKKDAITSADLDEYMRTYGDPKRMQSGFEYYRAVPDNMKAHAAAAPLPMPVLALGAEGGVGWSLHASLKDYCPSLSGGQVAGAGHYLPEEDPQEVTRWLLAFLAGAQAQAAASA